MGAEEYVKVPHLVYLEIGYEVAILSGDLAIGDPKGLLVTVRLHAHVKIWILYTKTSLAIESLRDSSV
jgi:hypothetical protein